MPKSNSNSNLYRDKRTIIYHKPSTIIIPRTNPNSVDTIPSTKPRTKPKQNKLSNKKGGYKKTRSKRLSQRKRMRRSRKSKSKRT